LQQFPYAPFRVLPSFLPLLLLLLLLLPHPTYTLPLNGPLSMTQAKTKETGEWPHA
jgi:hypothetical protein